MEQSEILMHTLLQTQKMARDFEIICRRGFGPQCE